MNIKHVATAALLVLAGVSTACASATESRQVNTARFTTVQFRNAPEALLRVQRVQPLTSTTVEVTTTANACSPQPGGTYTLRITNVGRTKIHAGQLLITGMATARPGSGNVWSVRIVNTRELASFGGCPRTKST